MRWCASSLQRCVALCHYAAHLSFHCAPCYKTVVTLRAGHHCSPSSRYGLTMVYCGDTCERRFRLREAITHFLRWDLCAPPATEAVPVTGPGPSKRRRTLTKSRVDEGVQFGETLPSAVPTADRRPWREDSVASTQSRFQV